MSAWAIVRPSLGPTSWPTRAFIPSTPCTSVAIGAQSIPRVREIPCCTRSKTDSASVAPPAGDDLSVAVAARAEGQDLESRGARLEGAGHFRRDADRVERLDLDDLVVELEQAAAADDHVDL